MAGQGGTVQQFGGQKTQTPALGTLAKTSWSVVWTNVRYPASSFQEQDSHNLKNCWRQRQTKDFMAEQRKRCVSQNYCLSNSPDSLQATTSFGSCNNGYGVAHNLRFRDTWQELKHATSKRLNDCLVCDCVPRLLPETGGVGGLTLVWLWSS